jgi:hypothetical protein
VEISLGRTLHLSGERALNKDGEKVSVVGSLRLAMYEDADELREEIQRRLSYSEVSLNSMFFVIH